MNKLAIFHRMDGVYGYQTKDNGIHIRLKAAKDDLKSVSIFYDDPFNWGPKNKEDKNSQWEWQYRNNDEIKKIETDGDFDYYAITIYNFNKRFKYYFKLIDQNDNAFALGEQGLKEWTNDLDGHSFGYAWGYACQGKINMPPKWWTQTDWYQVFPDRFAKEGKTLQFKTDHSEHLETLGGDLKGIIANLDYIKELGFDGLYINPIFEASSAHKYDTIDYLNIDSQFGTLDDFKMLVKLCHDKQMKIMIDGVFNHSGYEFEPWKDVLKNKENSKYKDWFWINDFSNLKNAFEYDQEEFRNTKPYETFGDTPMMPRLNWENQELRNYLKKVTEFWTKLGIDAWRLDVADAPSFSFWRFFRTVVKNINPDCAILGEVWYDALPFLHGDMFDTSMNYPFRTNLLNCLIKKEISIREFKKQLTKQKYLYSEYVNAGLFTLIGSHDVPRITTLAKQNEALVRSMFGLMFLSPGSISFYYGDEYNQIGRYEQDNRGPMDFNNTDHKTYKLIQKLNKIRKEKNEVIQQGFIWKDINSDKLEFLLSDNTLIYIDIQQDKILINNEAI